MVSRREFVSGAGMLALGSTVISRAGAASLPEAVVAPGAATQPPRLPSTGRPFHPVVTLNGWSMPWRMNQGVKEFHLVAEPVERELAPGMRARLWGYNGQSPGPTIEVVEGDRVRIFVTNRLREKTSIHWHGQRLPNGMDGVSGLTQPAIDAGKTFVYEFIAQRAGTFMYHPHADEMVQMAMGMYGFWVTHPKNPDFMRVDRDFVFLLNSFDVEPGSKTPKVNTMTEFNLWGFNSRVFPGIDSLKVRQGDRVRIRVGNLTMTNHPIHMHGHEFVVTGTDGGWTPPASRWPEVTVDIGVGQMRAFEFDATEPGDWSLHCHKSHHTMGPMGHNVPTMIGVDHRGIQPRATLELQKAATGGGDHREEVDVPGGIGCDQVPRARGEESRRRVDPARSRHDRNALAIFRGLSVSVDPCGFGAHHDVVRNTAQGKQDALVGGAREGP